MVSIHFFVQAQARWEQQALIFCQYLRGVKRKTCDSRLFYDARQFMWHCIAKYHDFLRSGIIFPGDLYLPIWNFPNIFDNGLMMKHWITDQILLFSCLLVQNFPEPIRLNYSYLHMFVCNSCDNLQTIRLMFVISKQYAWYKGWTRHSDT